MVGDATQPLAPWIDADTSNASRLFLARLRNTISPSGALLYGSRARRDYTPESDIDIAVVLQGRAGDRYKALRDMSDAAFDVLLETGLHVHPLPLWVSELERPDQFENPALIERIKREGVIL